MTKERIIDSILSFCENLNGPKNVIKECDSIKVHCTGCTEKRWNEIQETISKFLDEHKNKWEEQGLFMTYSSVVTGPYKTFLITAF